MVYGILSILLAILIITIIKYFKPMDNKLPKAMDNELPKAMNKKFPNILQYKNWKKYNKQPNAITNIDRCDVFMKFENFGEKHYCKKQITNIINKNDYDKTLFISFVDYLTADEAQVCEYHYKLFKKIVKKHEKMKKINKEKREKSIDIRNRIIEEYKQKNISEDVK